MKRTVVAIILSVGALIARADDKPASKIPRGGEKDPAQAMEYFRDADVSFEEAAMYWVTCALQAMDKRIKEQNDRVREAQTSGNGRNIDVEVATLKSLTDKRAQLYKMLEKILEMSPKIDNPNR